MSGEMHSVLTNFFVLQKKKNVIQYIQFRDKFEMEHLK